MKNRTKSYLNLLLITAVIGFLTTGSIAATTEIQLDSERRFLIGFAQDTMANDWRAAQVSQVEAELARYSNIDFICTDAEGQIARQILDIELLIERGIDVLITSPRDSTALTPVISSVYRRGIPVILIDRGIKNSDYTVFIRPDNYQIGRRAAQFIASRTSPTDRCRVFMLSGLPGASATDQRSAGFLAEISEHPQIKLVGEGVGNYLRADAIRAVETALLSGIEFDALYCHSDSMATGARLALKHAGISAESVLIIGIDYITEARDAIQNGTQTVSFTYPTGGTEGAKAAVKILRGDSVPRDVILDSIMVTQTNIKDVEPIF